MHRTPLLAALICVNIVLLGGLVTAISSPNAAQAQVSLAHNFVVVSGEAQDEFDVIYLIDNQTRFLHAFYFDRTSRNLKWAGYRDLELEFRNN